MCPWVDVSGCECVCACVPVGGYECVCLCVVSLEK